jgi:serine/threonine protein phosphatase PrpC
MTRSFGDTGFRDKGVISTPVVKKFPLSKYDVSYIILASDGVWEVMSSNDAASFVQDVMS